MCLEIRGGRARGWRRRKRGQGKEVGGEEEAGKEVGGGEDMLWEQVGGEEKRN